MLNLKGHLSLGHLEQNSPVFQINIQRLESIQQWDEFGRLSLEALDPVSDDDAVLLPENFAYAWTRLFSGAELHGV